MILFFGVLFRCCQKRLFSRSGGGGGGGEKGRRGGERIGKKKEKERKEKERKRKRKKHTLSTILFKFWKIPVVRLRERNEGEEERKEVRSHFLSMDLDIIYI